MGQSDAGHFLHNLLVFGRLLRELGLDINPGRMIDLVEALNLIEIGRKEDFYHAVRCLLVHRQGDIALFDQAFERFWRQHPEGWIPLKLAAPAGKSPQGLFAVPPPLRLADEPPAKDGERERAATADQVILEVTKTFSAREVLRRKDFAELTPEELDSVKKMMRQLAFQMGERRTRRRRPGEGPQIDLRRTLRRSFQHGGEVLTWARRRRKLRPRPLVVIADISGSMERYTRLLLHFIYGLAQSRHQPVEAFVFSTRLTRITRQLQVRDIEQALGGVAHMVQDWSGGTRIGEALKEFNFTWGRRVLGRGAAVMIISDGWDRGDMDLLEREMGRLQRSCHRLIWLNPLLGSPVYEPLTRGIQAALPFTDDFLPVHNLASLEDLAGRLGSLSRNR